MGHLLRRKGIVIKGVIGSMERFLGVALANQEQPSLVVDAHLEYLRAGARVITTNNYSCVPAALALSDMKESTSLAALIAAAGRLAREAVDAYATEAKSDREREILVAGCVPPLHESYQADRISSDDDELRDSYRLIVEHIAPHSDVLLCETMSSTREAHFALEAASKTGKPVWVSWTLSEDGSGRLRSGETVEHAAASAAKHANVEAMLFNCTSHASILAALATLREVAPAGVALGAYANGFRTVQASGGGENDPTNGACEYNEQLTPPVYAAQAREWVALGASIIGGCCGVFPEHIEEVAKLA